MQQQPDKDFTHSFLEYQTLIDTLRRYLGTSPMLPNKDLAYANLPHYRPELARATEEELRRLIPLLADAGYLVGFEDKGDSFRFSAVRYNSRKYHLHEHEPVNRGADQQAAARGPSFLIAAVAGVVIGALLALVFG
ncbi:MAG: hypothetical protein IJF59_02230 [Clostridia bacterium]|nr:hypothetical protein [Clostridia bacterium]